MSKKLHNEQQKKSPKQGVNIRKERRSLIALLLLCILMFSGFEAKGDSSQSSGTESDTVPGVVQEDRMDHREEFYVSPTGNDSDDGTKEHPYQTIQRAREEVAKYTRYMSSDLVVYLMDGTYYLDQTLNFGTRDDGNNGFQVRYEAYPNAKPVISGGTKLEGVWQLHDAKNNIYQLQVPAGMDFRQLYINGEKAVRARTGQPCVYDPSMRIQGAERLDSDGKVIKELWHNWDDKSALVQAAGGRIILPVSKWLSEDMSGLSHVELHVFTAWCENILRVDSIKRIKSYNCRENSISHNGKELGYKGECYVVNLKEEESNRIFNRQHPNIDNYVGGPHYVFYYENAYQYIDEPSEWYLDTDTNTLYYKAPENMDMNSVCAVAPKLEELVHIEGTYEDPVSNLILKGITFAHSTWLTASHEGLVDGQAGQYVNYTNFAKNDVGVKHAPAGIVIKNASHVRFDGNIIHYMGAGGILLESGTSEVTIINNTVENIAGNGIEIGKFYMDETTDYHVPYQPENVQEVCTNDRILNNIVRMIGTQYEGSVGIGAGYVQGITIANNEVSECPYSGISIGYGWTDAITPMNHNRVIRNEIFHINQMLCDAGSVYTLSNQEPGCIIAENYMHDNWLPEGADYASSGIYMDEQTMGYHVLRNVMVKSYGIYMRIPERNVNQNNFIFDKEPTGKAYHAFRTAEIQKIMKLAGVQKTLDEEGLFLPSVYATVYDPEYRSFEIYGTKFGETMGSITCETADGTKTTLDAAVISQWTDNQINMILPEGIEGTITLTVNTGAQQSSAKPYQAVIQSNRRTTAYTQDFESMSEGALPEYEWCSSVPDHASILTTKTGNVLVLTGNVPNLDVVKMDADGSNQTFGECILQYDFMFPEKLTGCNGTYNKLRIDAGGTSYTVNIRPGYNVPFSLEQQGMGELDQNTTQKMRAGVWYTCRTMVAGNTLFASVYEKGTEPPDAWELKMSMPGDSDNDSVLCFSFFDDKARQIYIDNIVVEEFVK